MFRIELDYPSEEEEIENRPHDYRRLSNTARSIICSSSEIISFHQNLVRRLPCPIISTSTLPAGSQTPPHGGHGHPMAEATWCLGRRPAVIQKT